MPTAAWIHVRPPMTDIDTLGLQVRVWAWERHPHLERTPLSRNSGNGKSMARKRAEAPQDDDDDDKKKKKKNMKKKNMKKNMKKKKKKNNNNNNNNPEYRNLRMTKIFSKRYEMG